MSSTECVYNNYGVCPLLEVPLVYFSITILQVMHSGHVVEFDKPYKLLQKKSSQLYKMVEKTGPEAARELHEMATKPLSS